MAPITSFQLPFQQAIAFFRAKKVLPTNKWNDVAAAYESVAFVVASVTKASILADLQEAIATQLEKGISPEQFKDTFRDIMIRRGWNPQFSPWRVNLILSQNARTSYSYGRWQQQEDPSFKQRHPYKIWQHRDSVVPRDHHLAQDGKVYSASDPIWKAIFPPPFGCKCTAYAMSQRQLEKEGLTVSKPPSLKSIAEPGFTGFPKNLEEQRSQLLSDAVKRLPPNLARLLEEDAENNNQ